jgi:type II secretion system protein G
MHARKEGSIMNGKRTASGFTLIELLIVVAIIAILAAIAVPNFLEAQTRSKVSRTKADMRTVSTALEAYRIDWPRYPTSYLAVDTTVEPRIARFVPLTTPVSYITTAPVDVFSRDVSSLYTDREVRVFVYVERNSYERWVTDPYGTSSNGRNVHATLWRQQFPAGQWTLRSRGPFGLAGGIDNDVDRTDAYDPTNGTVSAGNIMLLGSGIGFADGG